MFKFRSITILLKEVQPNDYNNIIEYINNIILLGGSVYTEYSLCEIRTFCLSHYIRSTKKRTTFNAVVFLTYKKKPCQSFRFFPEVGKVEVRSISIWVNSCYVSMSHFVHTVLLY